MQRAVSAPAVDLLGGGGAPAAPRAAAAPPAAAARPPPPPPAEMMEFGDDDEPQTQAERLQARYAREAASQKREWDAVAERWVDVSQPNDSTPGGADGASHHRAAIVGISLDGPIDASAHSPEVVDAMRQRQQEMRDAQEEAVAEVREREQKKKAEEAEFDRLRALLGPKLKEWSEQYGKKKDIARSSRACTTSCGRTRAGSPSRSPTCSSPRK